ncbi:MAG TPA: hypothetical protein VHO84_10095 [Syntrophorhabdaceae bacterium]|nr:hypothetical protein [Syntrophorhabdaceae bacterium]
MKRNKMSGQSVLISALLVSMLAFSLNASAAVQNPCSSDIEKYCKNIRGQLNLITCLERHEDQLSDGCKDYEAKMEKPRAESREAARQQMVLRQACSNEIVKLCNDPKLSSTSLASCLKKHPDQLSPSCRKAADSTKGGAEERASNKSTP